MSDTNDKKPNPNQPNWHNPAETPQRGQPIGHVAEDPLAALERIVSDGQPAEQSDTFPAQLGNGDDLRALEEELLKELRGEQAPIVQPTTPETPVEVAPAVHAPMPASAPAYTAPVEPAVPAEPVEPAIDLPSLQLGAAGQETQNDAMPVEPAYAPEPVAAPEPVYAPEPVAPAAPIPGPNLNFGVSQHGDVPAHDPVVSAPAPALSEAPVAPPVDQWAGLSDTHAQSFGASDEARTGSYGQLSDPMGGFSAQDHMAEPVVPVATPEVASPALAVESYAVEPSLSWPQSSAPVAEETPADVGDALSQAVVDQLGALTPTAQSTPAYEPVSSSAVDPMAGYSPAASSPVSQDASDPYGFGSVPASPAPAVTPSAPQVDSYVPSSVASDGQAIEDPYAAFNQPVAASAPHAEASAPLVDPMAGYQPAPGAAPAQQDSYYQPEPAMAAPSVNVAGQVQPGAYAEAPAQGYAGGYDAAPAAQQGYSEGLYGADTAPMASGPHGTYSDPVVSQAAAESMPYLAEDGTAPYQTAAEAGIDDAASAAPSKGRKGLLAAGVALGIAVIGGAVVWGLGGSGSDNGEAPVLMANNEPVKEAPEDPGGKVIPHQNKEVYDRIDGTKSDEGPGNLMPATEKPMALTPNGNSPRVISLSGGETSVPQQPAGSGAASPSGSRDAAAPKKVRTVIVRPDGTIVKSSDNSASQANGLGSVDQQMMAATPSEQAMGQSLNSSPGQGSGLNSAAGQLAGDAVTTSTLPKRKPQGLVQQQAAASVAPSQPASAQAAPNVTPTARPTGNQPLSLLPPATNQARPAAPAPAAPAPTRTASSGAGGYTVQVTSQRTPEQARASFANIQSRLAGVLGGQQPDIKRADLGAKGVYYRVRVGSFADRAGATSFCQSIKAAGGDCLVARK